MIRQPIFLNRSTQNVCVCIFFLELDKLISEFVSKHKKVRKPRNKTKYEGHGGD